MKQIKKLACGVIVLCMILSMLPMTAFASTVTASGTCGENLTWELTDEGVLTISGTGEMTAYGSKSQPWNAHLSDITGVIIEAGVTSIGDSAFSYCRNLTSVTIPEGVTSIGYAAFGGCYSLTDITIPDSVTSIGGAAFSGCAMTEITLPEGVTRIGWSAFVSCGNLTSLTIPASVTNIEEAITAGCVNLKEILVSEGNPNYCSDEFGVLYNKDKTTLIQYPCGREGASYSIPASVTNIGERAFYNCQNLTSVSLPEGITSISRLLFDGCHNLTNITIPDSVISIGEQAFSECYSLTSITIPDKVTSIGKFAFNDCDGLSSITIPASVTSIEENVFEGCYSLKEILVREENPNYCSDEFGVLYNKDKTTLIQYPCGREEASYSIPASVTSIETNAFAGCGNLQKITFNGNAPAIDDMAFMYDEYVFAYYPANDATWTEDVMQDYGGIIIWVPSGSPTIASGTCGENMTWELTSECVMTISGTGAMANCEWDATHWPRNYTKLITSVVIEDGVTGIGNRVFQSCENLTGITIPDGVTSIGDHAFEGCESLTSITIPSSVTELGEYPFDEHIKEITFEGSAPDGVWDALDCLTATVYYPASDDTWTANVWWQESLDNITWVPTGHQHVWGQWETVTAATATTDGEKRRECEGCDAYETEVIPAWETVVSPVIIAPTGDFEISTPENSQISAEEAEKTLFAMFYDLELFEQPDDTGINANTAVIEAAKANIRDDDGNPVVGANYLTSLLIGVGMCYVDAEGDTPVVTKITYDVVPCLVALDADGNVLGYAEMHELDSEVTFHLPVDKNTAADSAKVEHEGELMGYFSIKTDANGNKYVVVKSSSFSNYTVELHHHVYGDDGICDICGFNPNGNPNGKPNANPENPKTGDNGQLLLWAVLFLTGVFGIVALIISNDKKLYEGKYLN